MMTAKIFYHLRRKTDDSLILKTIPNFPAGLPSAPPLYRSGKAHLLDKEIGDWYAKKRKDRQDQKNYLQLLSFARDFGFFFIKKP